MLAPRRSRVDFSHKEYFSAPKLVDQTLATNDDDNLPANSMEECKMKTLAALLALSALGITDASAQVPFLSGQYQCVQNCQGPGLAFVTQNLWNLNLVNEVGEPSRAWIDYPGHIWAQYWNEGAVYSPDGRTIQFDNGAVWQRFVPPPPILRSRG
jgi:hypothetical protein